MKVSEIIKENVVSLGAKEYYDIINNLWDKEYSDIFKKAILNEIYGSDHCPVELDIKF